MVGTHSGIAMGFYGTSPSLQRGHRIAASDRESCSSWHPVTATRFGRRSRPTSNTPTPSTSVAGAGAKPSSTRSPPSIEIGGSNQLRDGDDISILAIGNLVKAACDASDDLKKEGIGARVVDMYSINPIDRDAIRRACSDHKINRHGGRAQRHRRLRLSGRRRHRRGGTGREAGQDRHAGRV